MRFARNLLASLLLVVAFSAPSALSQTPSQTPALGVVAKSVEGSIGETAALEGTTVYSGDSLSTAANGSLLVRVGALSLQLEPFSTAHIYRTPYGAIVELSRGSLAYTTPGTQQNVVIVAADVRITPAISEPDYGRVTIDDPCNVTVQSQKGEASVQAGSETRVIESGKAYRVRVDNQIGYRRYLSPDEDDYHSFHDHTPCAPTQTMKGHSPIAPGQSHFLLVASGTIGLITLFAVQEALESASRP